MRIPTHEFTGEQVAKRMLYLAYDASHAMGLGVMHARHGVIENELWLALSPKGEVYADYLVGRMMKLHLTFGADFVEARDFPLRRDYQSWCGAYPTYDALAAAALQTLREERELDKLPDEREPRDPTYGASTAERLERDSFDADRGGAR